MKRKPTARAAPRRNAAPSPRSRVVERVQTGIRVEKRILKVLKALAEFHDITLGDLLEGIVLHAFDGRSPFDAASQKRIANIKRIYELDLDASDSHALMERADDA
jgi:predicted DNA-binding ribbon-helix-helix protein